MTINKKLFAAFGTLLAITLAVCGIAIRNAGTLGESLNVVGQHYIHTVYLAGNIHNRITNLVSTSRGILLRGHLQDPARATKLKSNYDQEIKELKREAQELSEGTRYPEIHQLLQDRIIGKIDALDKAANDEYDAVMKGDLASADAINNQRIVPMGAALSEAGAELSEKESRAAIAYADEASASVPAAQRTSVAMILLSLLIGSAVLWIVRDITKALGISITELRDGADQVQNAAAQVAASSQLLAQGASQQAASLEETSASSEEINSMARRNTDNSRSTVELLAHSQTKVSKANEHLAEMVDAMNQITESSGKISKIIKVIDEIAFQTNILALNAAVEAARAGEAGMGFAVVADEVRSLAQRSSQAAKDTASLIEDSIAKSSEGTHKVDQVAATIRALTEDTDRVKVMVDEVSQGGEEQSRGINQIGRSISQMEQVTQTTAASAEESAAAAEELSAQSETMKDVVDRLLAMIDSGAAMQLQRTRHIGISRRGQPSRSSPYRRPV